MIFVVVVFFFFDEMVWISVDSWPTVYCTTINYQENKLEASVLCRDDRVWLLYPMVIYVFFCVNEHLYISSPAVIVYHVL